jgi:predicted nucleotide-binding protein
LRKLKKYPNILFDAKTISAAEKALLSLSNKKISYTSLDVNVSENEQWSFDNLSEFLAAMERGGYLYQASLVDRYAGVIVNSEWSEYVRVTVSAPTREEIETVFSVFDSNAERCRLPERKKDQRLKQTKVFIGHGHDPQWRDLKDHLHEKHGYPIEAYEIGSRAGHTIRNILEDMLEESSFALLVMTGEDETKDGKLRARQNVVHEAGLFQGRLGFGRAIILLEEGTEDFSNISGLHQIRFAKGRIAETYGEVLAVLKREIG